MRQIRVQIDAIDDEGRGRGNVLDSDGIEFDVAVRGAFPGDEALVQIERVFMARKLLVGKAISFFHRGDNHTERRCPYLGPCPACPLHGLNHALAVEVKRGRIEQALADQDLCYDVDDLVLHPNEFGYRQKVKLMAQVFEGQLRLGVYIPYSHDFEVAEQCPYVQPSINTAIATIVKRLNNEVPLENLTVLKAIILRASQNGVAAVIVARQALADGLFAVFNDLVEENVIFSMTERIQQEETNSILSGQRSRHLGPASVTPLEGGPLVDADSFCQSDPIQANYMYDMVANFLTFPSNRGLFVDAYAGVGGFSRALLRMGAEKIIAIEQSPNALMTLNQLGGNVEVILSPMGEALATLKHRAPIVGLVVDPPKKGLMQDVEGIADLSAQRLVLVSCDPDAMARDLAHLVARGYQVERIIPVDFFGGTPAVETIVMMTR